MLNQINLENIQSTTLTIKKALTNLKPLLEEYDDTKKGLLKAFKNNLAIENELTHLLNFLDNNSDSLKKELDDFKMEICVTGIKNKSSQITCLLDK